MSVETLLTAIVNTQLEEKFLVIHTLTLAATIDHISRITSTLRSQYRGLDWTREEQKGRPTTAHFFAAVTKTKNMTVCFLSSCSSLLLLAVEAGAYVPR